MTDEGLCPRALRAAVFAAACVPLSAVTFAVVGRGSAPLWAVLAALAAVYPLAWLGSGRARSLAGIGAVTVVVQIGLDYWFSLAQVDQSVLTGCGVIKAVPAMGETLRCARTASPAPAALDTDGALHVGLALLAAQLVVALISAICLNGGEHAQLTLRQCLTGLAAFTEALRRWWPALALALTRLVAPAAPSRLCAAPWATTRIRPKHPVLRHAVVRRGPPLTSCTALG